MTIKMIMVLVLVTSTYAQTVINGSRTMLGTWDASGAVSTKPAKSGTSTPVACSVGEVYFKTDSTAGSNIWLCTSTNVWTQVTTGGSSAFSSIASGTNTTAAMVVGSGASLNFSGTGSINASNLSGISGFGYGSRQADGTWTTRAFTGTASEVVITDGGGLSGNTNVGLASTLNLTSKTVRVPNSTTLPVTCTVGDSYMDTDATSGARWYLCESTNIWVAQGTGSGSSTFAGLTDLLKVTSTTSVVSVATGYIVYRDSASGVLVPQSLSAATLTRSVSGESGTIRIEVDDNGGAPVIRCLVSTTLTLGNHTASGCTKVAQNAFSEGAIPLATVAVSSGDYSTTPTDLRSPFAFWKYSNGTGLLLNGTVLSINSAVVGMMANANTWAAKQTFTPTSTTAGAQVICAALPSSPANGDVVCDSGDSNRVKVRSNGAWVAAGGGPGGSNTQIQWNNSGALGGDAGLTWDNTNKIVVVARSNTNSTGGYVYAGNTAAAGAGDRAGFVAYIDNNFNTNLEVSRRQQNLDGSGNSQWALFGLGQGGSYYNVASRNNSQGTVHLGGQIDLYVGWTSFTSGGMTRFANAATAGLGLAPIVAAPTELTGQTGNVGASDLYATGHTSGTYRVCGFVAVTGTGTGSTAAWTLAWTSPAGALTHSIVWSSGGAETATFSVASADEFNVCKVIRSNGTAAIRIDPGDVNTATYTTAWTVERLR